MFSPKQQLDQIQGFFEEREYKDKFSISYSQLLFNKSQLVSYELENREVKSYKKIIQKKIHILKRRFSLPGTAGW